MDVDAVARMESFRALKLTLFESFRVLKFSTLFEYFRTLKVSVFESFRALKLTLLEDFRVLKIKTLTFVLELGFLEGWFCLQPSFD